MSQTYKYTISLSYAACFTGFCFFLLFDHKARFWIELDLAPLIPWIGENALSGLIALLVLMAGGSYFDRLLLTEGFKTQLVLGFFLSLFLFVIAALLYALYLTNSHYTYMHDKFYITAIIIPTGSFLLWHWLMSRL